MHPPPLLARIDEPVVPLAVDAVVPLLLMEIDDVPCTEHALRSGEYVLAYDPKIGDPIKAAPEPVDIDLWAYWHLVQVPVLVVRGGQSDLLSADTVVRMRESHPHRRVDELLVADAGHAPALMADDQVAAVADWITRGAAPNP